MLNVTQKNFNNINKIVIFYTETCTPCHVLLDQFEDVDEIAKCNCMAEKELAIQLGIKRIPTVLVVEHGRIKKQLLSTVDAIRKEIN